ncbi:MAG: hypothetical protein CRN43_11755 [Candidatus Nephrothrix sp. EaCA]|nr:MAG: hypothetical protein CRN43_11755 [Candidatus Nephrothrix sp. EaCA]
MRTYILFICLSCTAWVACREQYIIGGEPNPTNKVNMTTYDYLKSLAVTSSTARLLERAGLQGEVNGNITFIAPSNYAVNRYLLRKNNRALRLNPKAAPLTAETIDPADLQQLRMYMIDGKFHRDKLTKEGIKFRTHTGDSLMLYIRQSNSEAGTAWDGAGTPGQGYQYTNFMQTIPTQVYVHFKRGENWEMDLSTISNRLDAPESDQVYKMYISDAETATGIVHIIYQNDRTYTDHYYYHSLFFFGTRQDDKL